MAANRNGNLGATAQPSRRRSGDPMMAFDALPAPLRQWLAQAALPWSPASCRKLWLRARAGGGSVADALSLLDRAQDRALQRETTR